MKLWLLKPINEDAPAHAGIADLFPECKELVEKLYEKEICHTWVVHSFVERTIYENLKRKIIS